MDEQFSKCDITDPGDGRVAGMRPAGLYCCGIRLWHPPTRPEAPTTQPLASCVLPAPRYSMRKPCPMHHSYLHIGRHLIKAAVVGLVIMAGTVRLGPG